VKLKSNDNNSAIYQGKFAMAPRKDEPLRKLTINLYIADCDILAAYYGHGWTEQVRQVVHQHIQSLTSFHKAKQTLGDLE